MTERFCGHGDCFFSCEEHDVCPATFFKKRDKSTADFTASLKNNNIPQRKCSGVQRLVFVFEMKRVKVICLQKNEYSSKVLILKNNILKRSPQLTVLCYCPPQSIRDSKNEQTHRKSSNF